MLSFLIPLMLLSTTLSAQQVPVSVSGRIIDSGNVPMGYTTLLLRQKADTLKLYGVTTDEQGNFLLKVPEGDYYFKATFLGYKPLEKELSLTRPTDLGTLMMESTATEIGGVTVVGKMITREADRFVVNVAASPRAIGQTAKEMLEFSPGVWVDESSGISINGKANTQVMINDRILRESGESLVSYLKTIKSEDIARIEVIPIGAAEYEAATQGGIIRIVLKRQRDNGVEGSVNMRYGTSLNRYWKQSFAPGFNINYRVNKASLYLNVNENSEATKLRIDGYRHNLNGVKNDFWGDMYNRSNGGTLRGGIIYDINDKHSISAEVNLQGDLPAERRQHIEDGLTYPDDSFVRIASDLTFRQRDKAWTISGNYTAKLDDKGSSFRLLLDYAHTRPRQEGNYTEKNTDEAGNPIGGRIYRSLSESSNALYSATGNFDLRAGEKGRVKAGFKYMFSEVDSRMVYEYLTDEQWVVNTDQSYATQYREHISALYGSYNYALPKRISLIVGMRVEHTYAQPAAEGLDNIEKQNYCSFFPNANLSIPLTATGSHQLIFSYARRIKRPSFWLLVPLRIPASATETRIGNPKLKSRFSNEINVDWVIAKKYTVTAGAFLLKDDWSWLSHVDPDDPVALIKTPENRAHNNMWFLAANIPVQVTDWWNLIANVNGSLAWFDIDEYRKTNHRLTGSISNSFTIRKGTHLLVSASGQTPIYWDYTKREGRYAINAGVTQLLLRNKLTAGVYVYDIFNTTNGWAYNRHPEYLDAYYYESSRPMLSLSLRYNFKSGKEFKAKTVESGADTSRISGDK